MTPLYPPFLTEEEVLFHRMQTFHQQRVEAVAKGKSPVGTTKDGVLVVHLIPQSSVASRIQLDGAKLIQAGNSLSAFGDDGRYSASRFNVDGLLLLDSEREPQSWSQIFRCGAIEAGSSAITFTTSEQYNRSTQNAPTPTLRYLRDEACEKAVFQLVGSYCQLCKSLQIEPPVTIFSSLVGCEGVRFYSHRGFNMSMRSVDRTPAFLPDIKIDHLDVDPMSHLRPWCDALFQSIGFEKSTNFDENGKWHERRH